MGMQAGAGRLKQSWTGTVLQKIGGNILDMFCHLTPDLTERLPKQLAT